MEWRAVTLPKSSHNAEENEDAFAPLLGNGDCVKESFFQCAVADGATRSNFSRIFADSLVNVSTNTERHAKLPDVIQKARQQWYQTLVQKEPSRMDVEKMKEGAYSTILWMKFFPEGTDGNLSTNTWMAQAIGDTCLFQFRNENPIQILPIRRSSDFNNHPPLIGSGHSQIEALGEWEYSGSWESGDDFFIATDAMAKWILEQVEVGKKPDLTLKQRLARESGIINFDQWIQSLRAQKEIRDDDTTLVWLKTL
jgi:hypothetical protein